MCAFEIMFTTKLEQRRLLISQQNGAPLRTYCTHTSHRIYEALWLKMSNHMQLLHVQVCICVTVCLQRVYFSLSYLTTSCLDQSSYVSNVVCFNHIHPGIRTHMHTHAKKNDHTKTHTAPRSSISEKGYIQCMVSDSLCLSLFVTAV